MKEIIVKLSQRSYPVRISFGLFDNSVAFSPLKQGDNAMLITNETLASIYINKICYLLELAGINLDYMILPDGEKYKSLTVLNQVFTVLLQKKHNRDTTLIAFGGGVIGDLTGFAAASYQRGVRLIQVPTTLLAQVDSAIGGKTAVNHSLGKNMIGAFWQPSSVIINLDYLKTLPLRELASGFAEVIKYGIIFDSVFFSWLEENIDSLLCLDKEKIFYCVSYCCQLKSKVVIIDERETGIRSLLNLGHTFAHAIETEVGYNFWLHGEVVAIGIVMAAYTSEFLGIFHKQDTKRIINLFQRIRLPVNAPAQIPPEVYLQHMMRDKKVFNGKIHLVLPLFIGKAKIYKNTSHDVILRAISECQKIC